MVSRGAEGVVPAPASNDTRVRRAGQLVVATQAEQFLRRPRRADDGVNAARPDHFQVAHGDAVQMDRRRTRPAEVEQDVELRRLG